MEWQVVRLCGRELYRWGRLVYTDERRGGGSVQGAGTRHATIDFPSPQQQQQHTT